VCVLCWLPNTCSPEYPWNLRVASCHSSCHCWRVPWRQVPFESLRRTTRDRKYVIDEVNDVLNSLKESAADALLTREQRQEHIQSLVARLQGLKRKVQDTFSAARAARLALEAALDPRCIDGHEQQGRRHASVVAATRSSARRCTSNKEPHAARTAAPSRTSACCPGPRTWWVQSTRVCCDVQLADCARAEREDVQRCRARLEHLTALGPPLRNRALDWNRGRLDRILVDHMLRCGYERSAAQLTRESGLQVRQLVCLPVDAPHRAIRLGFGI
jgi:hypothetical protein